MNKLKEMKKLGVLIVLAGVFLCGARQKLIRDPQGIKGHTKDVKWEISKGTGDFDKDDYILKIPIEYETNFSFDLEKWKNKLPPASGVSPRKDGSYLLDPYIIKFLTSTNPADYLLRARSDNYYDVVFKRDDNLWIVMREKEKWQAKKDITLYLQDYDEKFIHIINSPIKIHFSCSRKGCLLTDENGQVVNKIKIKWELEIDEKELAEAKEKRIQENKEIIKKQEEELKAERKRKEAERKRREREQREEAEITRKIKKGGVAYCLQNLKIVETQSMRITYPKEVADNAYKTAYHQDCREKIQQYYVEQAELRQKRELERLRQLGYY